MAVTRALRPQAATAPTVTASNEEIIRAFIDLQESLLLAKDAHLFESMGDSVYRTMFQKAMSAETYKDKAKFHHEAGRRAMQLGYEDRANRHMMLAMAYADLLARHAEADDLPAAVLQVATPNKELQAKKSVDDLDAEISKGRYREIGFPFGEFRNKGALLMSAPENWDGRSAVDALMVAWKGKWQLVTPLPDSMMSRQMLQALQRETGLIGFYLDNWKLDPDGNAVRYVDLSANNMTLLQSLLGFPKS